MTTRWTATSTNPEPLPTTLIKFAQTPYKQLARIEGNVAITGDGLEFELAMTESVTGPGEAVICRTVSFEDLESIRLETPFLRPWILSLVFVARNLTAFERIPGAKGHDYRVTVLPESKTAATPFMTDVHLRIVEAESSRLEREIEGRTGEG